MSVLSLLFHTFIRSLRLLLCPYADIRLTHIHVIITITYLVTSTLICFRERVQQNQTDDTEDRDIFYINSVLLALYLPYAYTPAFSKLRQK